VSRGSTPRALALEGSLAGAIDRLETDCCLTADGQLLLLHDPLLTLGTPLDGLAHQRTAAEIRAGRLRDASRNPTDQPLGLDQLLAAAPTDVPVQVEVKALGDPRPPHRGLYAVRERLERLEAKLGVRMAADAVARTRRPERLNTGQGGAGVVALRWADQSAGLLARPGAGGQRRRRRRVGAP
jgi:glycerophosphoryl diester phosphodiesterase